VRVLLVEDNELVAELVKAGFENSGWHVDMANTVHGASGMLARQHYDSVVLDIELPDTDGYTLLSEIRRRPTHLPVVMLTARSGPDHVVKGLGAGADDYVAKPFDMAELVARVLAVMRRAGHQQEVLQYGDVVFNRLTRETTVDGRRVRLTPKEQTFMEQLLMNAGNPVSREDLLQNVWRINFDPGSNLMDAHVARLRGKLKNANARVAIVTYRTAGFALELSDSDQPQVS
jgi:two-component system, OmpR family, response regulator